MSYVRAKMINGYGPYYYLVKSERVNGKPRQIHIAYLGKNAKQHSGTATAATLKEAKVSPKDINTTHDIQYLEEKKPQETKKMEKEQTVESIGDIDGEEYDIIYVGGYEIPSSIEDKSVGKDVIDTYGDVSKLPRDVLLKGRKFGWIRPEGGKAKYGFEDELEKSVPKPWAAAETTAIILPKNIIQNSVQERNKKQAETKQRYEEKTKSIQTDALKNAKESGHEVVVRKIGSYDGDEIEPGSEKGQVIVYEVATPDGKIITKEKPTY